MNEIAIKAGTFYIALLWVTVTLEGMFSITLSAVGTLYFIAMLKLNIVNKHYGGSWKRAFSGWFSNKDKTDKNR